MKVYNEDSVTGWVVVNANDVLIGPFDSLDEAEAWMRELNEDGEDDLSGYIRPILTPYVDDPDGADESIEEPYDEEDEADEDEDDGDCECEWCETKKRREAA